MAIEDISIGEMAAEGETVEWKGNVDKMGTKELPTYELQESSVSTWQNQY